MKFLVILLILPFLQACLPTTHSTPKVINGFEVSEEQDPAIVKIGGCTGTFIADDVMITAGHCVCNKERIRYGSITSIEIILNPKYPSWQEGERCGKVVPSDTAIVKFPKGTAKATMALCKETHGPGTSVRLVGYGCNQHTYNEQGDFMGTHSCTGNKIKRVGYNVVSPDKPDTSMTYKIFGQALTTTADGSNAVPAPGDSGSPLLIEEGGVECIAGINSGGGARKRVEENWSYSHFVNIKNRHSDFLGPYRN